MIANQAKALEYQIQSLWNEAQNLQANPLQLLGQIQGMWNAYNTIMGNAEGLASNLTQAGARFEAAYSNLPSTGIGEIATAATRMLGSIRAATKTAVSTQSIYERLCNELAANQQALTAAQASQGALQIAQAQAQIQALTNAQLATSAKIEAANGRVQTEWIAMQVKERVDADAAHTAFMTGYGAQGFKRTGQTQGVPLPYGGTVPPSASTLLGKLLNTLFFTLSGGYARSVADVFWLLSVLAPIELVIAAIAWAMYRSAVLAELFWKILGFAFLFWIVDAWPTLLKGLRDGFIEAGLLVGGNVLSLNDITDPGNLVDFGFSVTALLFNKLAHLSPVNYGFEILIGGISGELLIRVPFLAHQKTAFIGERGFGTFIAHALQLQRSSTSASERLRGPQGRATTTKTLPKPPPKISGSPSSGTPRVLSIGNYAFRRRSPSRRGNSAPSIFRKTCNLTIHLSSSAETKEHGMSHHLALATTLLLGMSACTLPQPPTPEVVPPVAPQTAQELDAMRQELRLLHQDIATLEVRVQGLEPLTTRLTRVESFLPQMALSRKKSPPRAPREPSLAQIVMGAQRETRVEVTERNYFGRSAELTYTWQPGRVYPVLLSWHAPTLLTLSPGERLIVGLNLDKDQYDVITERAGADGHARGHF